MGLIFGRHNALVRKMRMWLAATAWVGLGLTWVCYSSGRRPTYRFMAGTEFYAARIDDRGRACAQYVVRRPVGQVFADVDLEYPGPWMWECISSDLAARGKWIGKGVWVEVTEFRRKPPRLFGGKNPPLPTDATGFVEITERPTARGLLAALWLRIRGR